MLNYGNADFDLKSVEAIINKRMQWNHEAPVDIMIIREDKIERVLRYNKQE